MSQLTEEAISGLVAYVDLYSLATLKRVTRTLNLSIAASSREGFVQGLTKFLGTDAHRQLLEKRLSSRDWLVLDVLPFRIGPIRIRDFVAALRDREFSPRDALAELERLLSLGCFLLSNELTYNQRQGIDQSSLRIAFHDGWIVLTPAINEWARNHRPTSLGLSPVAAPRTSSEASFSELHRAIFILLSETARKPIRMTTKGSPYKAEIARLADALAPGSPASGRGSKRSKGTSTTPAIFWFALAALIASELLVWNGQEVAPSADAREFLASPTDHQVRRLLTGWLNGRYDDFSRIPTLATFDEPLERDARPDPWRGDDDEYDAFVSLGSIGRARAVVVEALNVGSASDRSAWYSIDDLATLAYQQDHEMLFPRYADFELLNEHGYRSELPGHRQPQVYYGLRRVDARDDADAVLHRDRDWREVEGAFTRQALVESLAWLGLVDVGPSIDSADRFRLTELGQHVFSGSAPPPGAADSAPRAVVQPNFEVVVVNALANTALLSQLDEFAERRSIDRAATYRLTQADLLRGLDRGWTERRVFDLLESTSSAPVPQNVAYTLREWIAAYERLTVREQASLLEADDPAQLDAWLRDPTILSLLAKRLGPTSVLVASKDVERLLAALASRGGPTNVVDYREPRASVIQVRDPDLVELTANRAEPYLVYRLEGFAEPLPRDRKRLTYRLTRDSVGRAVRDGWKGPEIIEFLSQASGAPLPVDVHTRLTGWSGSAAPLVFETLVAVSLPARVLTWEILRAIPSIGPLIRAIPLPGLALVDAADLEKLRAELTERGIETRSEILPSAALEPTRPSDPFLADTIDVLKNPILLLRSELEGFLGRAASLQTRGTPRR